MYKLFSTIFGNKKTKNKKIMCGVTIEVNIDGTVNILCSWPEFDKTNSSAIDPISTEFSTLLYFLNKGFLSKEIINTLTNLSHPDNQYDNLFVDMTLSKWTNYIESKLDIPHDMEPMVRPSSVFNNRN